MQKFGLDTYHRLRSNTAGPENRQFVRTDFHGITVVWPGKITDSNEFGMADVNRSTMHGRVLRGDLNSPDGVGGFHGTHGDNHGSVKHPAGAVWIEVRYIGTFEFCSI